MQDFYSIQVGAGRGADIIALGAKELGTCSIHHLNNANIVQRASGQIEIAEMIARRSSKADEWPVLIGTDQHLNCFRCNGL